MKLQLTTLIFILFYTHSFAQNKSQSQDNIAIIKNYYKAFNENDPKKMASFFADGFVDYGYGNKPPITYKSSADYEKKLEEGFKNSPAKCVSSNEEYLLGEDGKVVVLADYTNTMLTDVYGTKGRSHTHHDADIYILNKEGKIISHRWIFPGYIVQMMLMQNGLETN